MYLAEFAIAGTAQLAKELLIQAPSQDCAQSFAQDYASHWGVELFSITPMTEQQVRASRLMNQAVVLTIS